MLRDQSPATESFAGYSYRMDQMDLEGGTNGGAVSKSTDLQRSDVDSKRILAEEGLILDAIYVSIICELTIQGNEYSERERQPKAEAAHIELTDYAQESAFQADLSEASTTALDYAPSNVQNA
ncbi:hypothetical protein F444_09476 [Phytophthora nicotianae P1976]|uniref:Uncharacterized protein n=2 Tax=Phytophthora nicotianae TaxID=4792 RepID=A0A081A7L0_PHYNI|nr:hypothetical protein F444_09476 [Phytophthora nicotianae P1976]